MKLIVGGGTGFVATEVIRQALQLSHVTSIIALARREVHPPIDLPSGTDASKLQTVVLEDFENYSEHAKKQISGADACIWSAAITPLQLRERGVSIEEAKRVSHDYAMTCFKTVVECRGSAKSALRFIYVSGAMVTRDLNNLRPVPDFLKDYVKMRGQAEIDVVSFANQHELVEAGCARPGLITGPNKAEQLKKTLESFKDAVVVTVEEVAAAMLTQLERGFVTEPLLNDDLIRIGSQALKTWKSENPHFRPSKSPSESELRRL